MPNYPSNFLRKSPVEDLRTFLIHLAVTHQSFLLALEEIALFFCFATDEVVDLHWGLYIEYKFSFNTRITFSIRAYLSNSGPRSSEPKGTSKSNFNLPFGYKLSEWNERKNCSRPFNWLFSIFQIIPLCLFSKSLYIQSRILNTIN